MNRKHIWKTSWPYLLLAMMFVLGTSYCLTIGLMNPENQWDFRAHFFSSKVFMTGGDPYDLTAVNAVNDSDFAIPPYLRFVYHPYTSYFFSLFHFLPFAKAVSAYMALNFFLLFILLLLWKRYLGYKELTALLLLIFLFFAFNRSLLLGLAAGNTAIIEAFFIWIAMVTLMKQRVIPFLILVFSISLFKGYPLLLSLLIVFLPEKKKNVMHLLTGLTAFSAIWFSPVLFRPGLLQEYWSYAANVNEIGIINPCFRAFISELVSQWNLPRALSLLGYGSWVLAISGIFIYRVRTLAWEDNSVSIIFFTLLTYALIVPRFKDYAYIQIIPIAFSLSLLSPVLFIVNLATVFISKNQVPDIIYNYQSFLILCCNWAYMVVGGGKLLRQNSWMNIGSFNLLAQETRSSDSV